jgi:hypothetical protein
LACHSRTSESIKRSRKNSPRWGRTCASSTSAYVAAVDAFSAGSRERSHDVA